MKFYCSSDDKAKRAEFHTKEFVHDQLQAKNLMQAELIKALDELASIVDSNTERSKRLQEAIHDSLPNERLNLYKGGIVKYENLTFLSRKVSEIFLIQLDMYTYGTYFMLAENEWDWRAFARHLYTILCEHAQTVNRHLNDILRILKSDKEENYDLTSLIQAKKEFSSFISYNSEFAKQIRVNVDAHYDGVYAKRLSLIKDLSYCKVLELYYTYLGKMQAFLHELMPALNNLRLSADLSYNNL